MSEPLCITLSVNGEDLTLTVSPRTLLSDALRDQLGLTGTHIGCEHGVCGACTVLVDGRPARACLTFAVQMEGHELTTIEGIKGAQGGFTAFQQALHENHGLQCGFCTPGIVISMETFLRDHPDPTEDGVRDLLSGHLCRCTGYQAIVAAALAAAATMREQPR